MKPQPAEQKPNESLFTRTTAFFSKINIFKAKPSIITNPTNQKEEEEDLKTAIELDDKLSAFNIVQISALILVSLFHSFGILIIAFFFSIYQIILSIFHIIKFCWENPLHFKYGYQALKYAYEKEWWTLKGIYRWITEPPPPPVFAQRTLSGEIKMDPEDVAKLEAIRMKKMFHQKCLNGKFLPAEFVPPQNLELLIKKNK
uniref:Uncharacterized protein n=1 Tax=Panagrolaimus sp. PS1159 TaxID=55785 RepID=A0AC35G193_9BILA